jgi:ACS family glucarate transporter-like MFS transporter
MIHWGWRLGLIASSVPALAMALIWLRIPEAPEVPDRVEIVPQPQGGHLRSRNFILLTISYTLQGYVGYIFVSWFYLYLVQERHVNLLTGAWMGSMPWVLSIISIPLGGFLSDRFASGWMGPVWGRRAIPMVGMGFSGVLISVGAHTESAWVAAISLAFATALVMCVEGPFWTMMIQIAGKRSGSAGGTMNMGSNAGGLLSPVLTPVLAMYIGWENALHIAAGIAVAAALLWLGIRPHDEPKRHTQKQ